MLAQQWTACVLPPSLSLVSGQIKVPDHLDLDYYDGLASEELRTKQVGGAVRMYFERVVRRNEPLDALCYALAASRLVFAGILDGTDGKPSTIWARYGNGLRPMTAGYLNGWQPFYGTPGSEISRERGIVSQLNLDLLFSNPVVSTLVENYVCYAVGNGRRPRRLYPSKT